MHFDAIIQVPTVWVDGEPVLADGKILLKDCSVV
tara:strand:- start:306 stop:407 length:102 start_codon:yes stop_codon:yes gene_type:complete